MLLQCILRLRPQRASGDMCAIRCQRQSLHYSAKHDLQIFNRRLGGRSDRGE
jgi:hypothetical protein